MYWKNYWIRSAKKIFIQFPKKTGRIFSYWSEFIRFRRMKTGKRHTVLFKDTYPCLSDKIKTTPFDHHYLYHPAWAARILAKTKPAEHTDLSSILHFGTMLSAFIPVKFYDYRPAVISLPGYSSGFADLKKLPFADHSIESLSCMHTVEHIGLGRYGDELDPDGDLKAMEELKRVIKPGGSILFVTPVGKPRVEFNAHRIYSYEQILGYFSPLTLKEFSLIPDTGGLIERADPALVKDQLYACGCFWFIK